MSDIKLPIEVIPNTHPPRFRWRRTVDTLVGKKVVECEGCLPPSVEDAVIKLITIAAQNITTVGIAAKLLEENERLKSEIEQLLARPPVIQVAAPVKKGRG